MAAKKTSSRAQKAVTDVKRKNPASSTSLAKTNKKKNSGGQKMLPTAVPEDNRLPIRFILATVSAGLFILFLVISINPDGFLLEGIKNLLLCLIGKVGFYFSIPALLYLFVILVSSGKHPVKMRCFSLISFVLICGCIFHLVVNNQTFIGGFAIVKDLCTSGIQGYGGGLICGLIAMLVRWACGDVISYIIFILGAVFTLLAAMNITIPSIVRAIKNRPRDDWDADEFEEIRPEPAAVVVNHIANKRIEQKRQRREAQQMAFEDLDVVDEVTIPIVTEHPAPKRPAKPQPQPQVQPQSQPQPQRQIQQQPAPVVSSNNRASDMLSQIEGDIGEPVSVSANHVQDDSPAEVASVHTAAKSAMEEEDLIPIQMPVFKPDAPIPAAPKTTAAAPVAAEPVVKEKVTAKDTAQSAAQVAAEIAQANAAPKQAYSYPPIELLRRPPHGSADGTAEMRENSNRLNETLASFKIDARIINVTRGPSVTRYEVELDKGVRLSKLTSCADDIALSLGASGVRIAAVPGKISIVGIEVPNRAVTMVSLREVIDSPEFHKSKSKSSFAAQFSSVWSAA